MTELNTIMRSFPHHARYTTMPVMYTMHIQLSAPNLSEVWIW